MQGFFDATRNRFIVPQAAVSEIQALAYSESGSSWSFECVEGPPKTIVSQALDLENDRAIYFGSGPLTPGAPDSWGIWELSLSPRLAWKRLDLGLDASAFEYTGGSQAVVDAKRDRLLLVQSWYPTRRVGAIALNGATAVTPVTQSHPPPTAFWFEHVELDPVGDRLLTFLGLPYDYMNQVYVLPLSVASPTWQSVSVGGTPPSPRSGSSFVFDRARNRLLLAGGTGENVPRDVWELRFSPTPMWTQLSGLGTAVQGFLSRPIGYDAASDRLLLYSNYPADDVWAFSLGGATWQPIATRPPALPGFGGSGSAAFDRKRGRLIHHRGQVTAWAASPHGALMESGLLAVGPPRTEQASLYDPHRDRFVMVAGRDQFGIGSADVWGLALAGDLPWSLIPITGTAPSPRSSAAAIYAPAQDRAILHGGWVGTPRVASNETWALDFRPAPHWSLIGTSGPSPEALVPMRAAYDLDRHRMLLFYRGVWELPLDEAPTWRKLETSGPSPEVRAAVFDDARGRVVVRGNQSTWELTLDDVPTWRRMSPEGVDPGPVDFDLVYDPAEDQVLLAASGQVWALYRGRPAIPVVLDLKPRGPLDQHPQHSGAPLRVALRGSAMLDMSLVDIGSVRLAGVAPLGEVPGGPPRPLEDVDRDGHLDLLLAFEFAALEAVAKRGPLVARGTTTDGRYFRGEATLTIRGRRTAPGESGPAMEGGIASAGTGASFQGGRLVVRLGDGVEGDWTVDCFDVMGRQLASRTIRKSGPGPLELVLPESAAWSPGLTFVRLRNATREIAIKAVHF